LEPAAAVLRAALKTLALRIDHHGSTAIPGLGAKPIIDIQVTVAALQHRTTRSVRSSIGPASGRIVITCTSSKGADLKRSVVAQVADADTESQERYAVAKTDFIERVVGLAFSNGYPLGA